jgi:hypothetical protein
MLSLTQPYSVSIPFHTSAFDSSAIQGFDALLSGHGSSTYWATRLLLTIKCSSSPWKKSLSSSVSFSFYPSVSFSHPLYVLVLTRARSAYSNALLASVNSKFMLFDPSAGQEKRYPDAKRWLPQAAVGAFRVSCTELLMLGPGASCAGRDGDVQ